MALGRKEMVSRLCEEYPFLRDEVEDPEIAGLATLEIAPFRRYVQDLIDSGDSKGLASSFEAARRFYLDGDDQVRHAVRMSFLSDLNFTDGRVSRSWAFRALPEPLRSLTPA